MLGITGPSGAGKSTFARLLVGLISAATMASTNDMILGALEGYDTRTGDGGRRFNVVRYGPIITPDMLPDDDGKNINGPSLVKVPAWTPDPLGADHLYFGHHNGDYIRLAYSDSITGPYTIHAPGTLTLADAPGHAIILPHPRLHRR